VNIKKYIYFYKMEVVSKRGYKFYFKAFDKVSDTFEWIKQHEQKKGSDNFMYYEVSKKEYNSPGQYTDTFWVNNIRMTRHILHDSYFF